MTSNQEVGTAVAEREEARPPVKRPDGVSMVEWAIQHQVDPGTLAQLVDLEFKVQERNARAAYFEALASFQEACPPILKSKDGLKTKSGTVVAKYAPLDQCLRVMRPVLARHGFSFSWNSRLEGGTQTVECVLRHVEGHEESASFSTQVASISPLTSTAQNNSGAVTYGQRLSLLQVTGIATADEDMDGAAPPREPLDDGRVADMEALIEEVGADRTAFLAWLGVDSIAAIPEDRYQGAVNALERKRGRA